MKFKRKLKSINGIERADIVRVIDIDQTYVNYSQIAKKLGKWDQLHWAYKVQPNPDHKFQVIDILNHVMENRYDRGTVVIVIQDVITSQVFLINELGIELYRKNPDKRIKRYNVFSIKLNRKSD